jgi:hypothetical protein
MLKAFRILCLIIAIEVMVQASMIAFAIFGLGKWIEDDGGVLNKAVLDADKGPSFTGSVGFMIHGINGEMVIPLLALITLVVSFFTKVPGSAKRGGMIFGLVVLQVLLGVFGHGVVALGPLHGINAFVVFSLAIMTFVRFGKVSPGTEASASTPAVVD